MQSEIHAQNVYLLFISRILTVWSHLPLLRPLKVAVQEHKPWLRVWTKAQVGRWVQLTSQRPYMQMGTHSSFQSISQGSFWFCPLLHLYIHIKKKKTHPILQKNKLLLQGVASSYSWEFSKEILVGFGCLASPNSFGNPSLVVLWGGIKTAFWGDTASPTTTDRQGPCECPAGEGTARSSTAARRLGAKSSVPGPTAFAVEPSEIFGLPSCWQGSRSTDETAVTKHFIALVYKS